jgi:hypothetical protein
VGLGEGDVVTDDDTVTVVDTVPDGEADGDPDIVEEYDGQDAVGDTDTVGVTDVVTDPVVETVAELEPEGVTVGDVVTVSLGEAVGETDVVIVGVPEPDLEGVGDGEVQNHLLILLGMLLH